MWGFFWGGGEIPPRKHSSSTCSVDTHFVVLPPSAAGRQPCVLETSCAASCLPPLSVVPSGALSAGEAQGWNQACVLKEIVLQSTIAELTKVFSVGSTSPSFLSLSFFFPSPNMKWDKTVIKYAIKGIKGFVKIWGIWSSANGCSACVAEFYFFFYFQKSQVHQGFLFSFFNCPGSQ